MARDEPAAAGLSSTPRELRPLEAQPSLIVFGGAFDPPHQGHTDMLWLALAAFPKAQILVLPAAQPATASGLLPKHANASFDARMQLCELAFGSLGDRLRVLPLEAELPAPNRTLTTLGRVRELHPSERLGFLLGEDQLAAFPRWHEPKAILATACLVAAPRGEPSGGQRQANTLPATIASCAAALGLLHGKKNAQSFIPLSAPLTGDASDDAAAATPQGLANAANTTPVGPIFCLPGPISPAASHILRDCFARAQLLPDGWLSPSVLNYIHTHHLYSAKASGAPASA